VTGKLVTGKIENKQPALIHWILDHPKLAGFVAAVALAVAFSPKASTLASWICLAFAMIFGIAMLVGVADKRRWKTAGAVTSVVLFVLLVAVFGVWLTDGKQFLEDWYLMVFNPRIPFPAARKWPSASPPSFAYNHTPKRHNTNDPYATVCTLKGGTYYPDASSLPGGPKLQRPVVILNRDVIPMGTTFFAGDTLLLMKVVLINRGEASIVKDWQLCIVRDGKPFTYRPAPIPSMGIPIIGTSDKITPDQSLIDNVIRTPIERADTAGGWITFKVTTDVAGDYIAGKRFQGSLRYKDYLDHEYSFDFGPSGDTKDTNVYIPGARPNKENT
jgi:hypothetical protein